MAVEFQEQNQVEPCHSPGSVWEILKVSTRLGITSFGGPIAHLGYFHEEYVHRRQWLDEHTYADLVALCQFLPGPASSQVGISIGLLRAGWFGGLAAWIGFTLPSAIALIVFAYCVSGLDIHNAGWLHGLMVVAVAVVAQAVWGMARKLATGVTKATIAVISALTALLMPSPWTQVATIVLAAVVGRILLRPQAIAKVEPIRVPISRRAGLVAWGVFFAFLILLPLVQWVWPDSVLGMFNGFYRSGSLVFGGGHVVLPLLQQSVVTTGWMTNAQFLAGYGAAQAVPGPLFTVAAYLGAVSGHHPSGWLGGTIALVAMFLPAFLLVVGSLPFWGSIRTRPGVQSALGGVNASVVGILIAALYNPVWVNAIHGAVDFGLALVAFVLLVTWKIPPWIVVMVTALAGIFA